MDPLFIKLILEIDYFLDRFRIKGSHLLFANNHYINNFAIKRNFYMNGDTN